MGTLMDNIMVFDIETVPDVVAGARIKQLENLPQEAVAEALFFERRQQSGHEMLPLHLHHIVAISVVLYRNNTIKVWSLGEPDSEEKELLQRFFQGLERFEPTLVSWNGSGFDLPVLHYRAMLNRVTAPAYWETGDNNTAYRHNNYISRYHARHTDLMDVLALYNGRAYVALDQMASLLGYPGKMGMDGSKVWPAWQAGKIEKIRQYCETDVLNTFLIYLRFEHMRGRLTDEGLQETEALVRQFLNEHRHCPHWAEFSGLWPDS